MLQTKVAEKIKTPISCLITFFKNCTIYEIMWKNIVQLGRPQMTIWDTHIPYWIHMATNTHPQYVILIAFLLQQWLHKQASMLRYMYHAYIVYIQTTRKFATFSRHAA
jgi:hypothetical protein